MLEERLRAQLQGIRDRKRAKRGFPTKNVKKFIADQRDFLDAMLSELVDEESVTKGYLDDSHLLSDDLKAQYWSKA